MGDVVFISSTESANSVTGFGSGISPVQVLQTCYSLTQIQPRYLWKKPFLLRRQGGVLSKQIKDYMRGRQRVNSCYARLLEARSGRGQKTTSRSSVFTGSAFLLVVRADAVSLPHLSSPLPVPLRVLVPGLVLPVAAAAVSMCDGPQGVHGRVPLPALRLPARLWN